MSVMLSTGVAPAGGATIAEVQSQPFPAILAEMLTTSDNNSSEMILKEIGYQTKGQGTRTAGLQVIMERLTAWGVPTAGVSLVDGSGLSDASRATCAAILGVLEHGSPADAVGEGMPAAGAPEGTLSDIFTDGPLAGKLRGQDGHAEPELQSGTARRQVARWVCAAGRRRGNRIRAVAEWRVHREQLQAALGPTRSGVGAVPDRPDHRDARAAVIR